MTDRRYWVGFVGGMLTGVAFGIPGGYALLRDGVGTAAAAVAPAATPPTATASAVTPPAVTPPAVTPPAVTPPAVAPPAVAPSVATLANQPIGSQVASLVDEGRRAFREGQPERALLAVLEAERLEPQNPNIKNNLCTYLGELRRYDDAILACEAALGLQPDFQLARNNLAWVKKQRTKASPLSSSRVP